MTAEQERRLQEYRKLTGGSKSSNRGSSYTDTLRRMIERQNRLNHPSVIENIKQSVRTAGSYINPVVATKPVNYVDSVQAVRNVFNNARKGSAMTQAAQDTQKMAQKATDILTSPYQGLDNLIKEDNTAYRTAKQKETESASQWVQEEYQRLFDEYEGQIPSSVLAEFQQRVFDRNKEALTNAERSNLTSKKQRQQLYWDTSIDELDANEDTKKRAQEAYPHLQRLYELQTELNSIDELKKEINAEIANGYGPGYERSDEKYTETDIVKRTADFYSRKNEQDSAIAQKKREIEEKEKAFEPKRKEYNELKKKLGELYDESQLEPSELAYTLQNVSLAAAGFFEDAARFGAALTNRTAGAIADFAGKLVGQENAGQFFNDAARENIAHNNTRENSEKFDRENAASPEMLKAKQWTMSATRLLMASGLSALTGGLGSAGTALGAVGKGTKVLNALGGIGNVSMAFGAAGGGAYDAYQESGNLDQALRYGLYSGSVELLTEKIADGIPNLQGSDVAESLAKELADSPKAQQALKYVIDAFGEGGEEALSEFLDPIVKRATYNPGAELASTDEIVDAALNGIIQSAALQGAFGAANRGADMLERLESGRTGNSGYNFPSIYDTPPIGEQTRVQLNEQGLPENASVSQQQTAQVNPAMPAEQSSAMDIPRRIFDEANPEPVKAGRTTTIYNPYTKGPVPENTRKSAETARQAVTVTPEAYQETIDIVSQAQQTEGQSFKGALRKKLTDVFKRTHKTQPIEVQGVTFGGEPYFVEIGNKAVGKIVSDPNLSAEKISLLQQIDNVVTNGEYVGSGGYGKNKENKATRTIRYDYFETPVTVNGKEYIASFDVEVLDEKKERHNFRTYKLNKIDLIPQTGSGEVGPEPTAYIPTGDGWVGPIPTAPAGKESGLFTNNIPRDGEIFNQSSKNNLMEPHQKIADRSEAERLGAALGMKVEFASLPEGTDGIYKDGKITINANTARSYETVLKHELAHAVENSKAFSDFKNYVLNYIYDSPGYAQKRTEIENTYRPIYEANGQTFGTPELEHELLADFVGNDLLRDTAALERVAAEAPSTLKKIGQWMKGKKSLFQGEMSYKDFLQNAERKFQRAWEKRGTQTDGKERYLYAGEKEAKIPRGMEPRVDSRGQLPAETEGGPTSRAARTIYESPTITNDQAAALKKMVESGSFAYEPSGDKAAVERAKRTIATRGFDAAMEDWSSVVNDTRPASKAQIVLGEQLLTEAAARHDAGTVLKLASELAIEGSRAGQMVQAYSLIKKLTPEGQAYYLQKSVDKINRDLSKKYKDKVKPITLNEGLVSNLLQAENQADMEDAVDAIFEDVAKHIPSTVADKLDAWRYFSMLSSPRTHIRNITGNAAMLALTRTKNEAGALLEKVFLDKEKRTKSLLRATKEQRSFAQSDFSKMAGNLGGGKTGFAEQIDQYKKTFGDSGLGNMLEFFTSGNSNLLEAEDTFFKRTTYVDSFSRMMKARGLTAEFLRSGTAEANAQLGELRKYASQEALRATFQDFNRVASALNRVEKSSGVAKVLMGGTIPFKKTPFNIAKRAVEYSPIGLADSLTRGLIDVARGRITGAQCIDRIASGMTGTGAMILGYFLADLGILRATGEDEDKKAYFEKDAGQQDYSLRIGNKSYTLDWLSPVNMPVFMGVEAYELINNGGETEGTLMRGINAISKITNPLMDLSMMQGINQAIESYNSDGIGGSLGTVAENAVYSFAGQFVPTIFGQVARTVDPVRRTTYASKDSPVTKSLEQQGRKIGAKLPIVSTTLEPYVDMYGREQVDEESIGMRLLKNTVFPWYSSEYQDDPVTEETRRLYNKTGETGVLTTSPGSSVVYKDQKYNLSPKEYTRLKKTVGQKNYAMLESLYDNTAYKALSDADKAEVVKDIYTYTNAIGKREYLQDKGVSYTLESWMQDMEDAEKEGIQPTEYLLYKQKMDSFKGGEEISATQKKFDYIETLPENKRDVLVEKFVLSDSAVDSYDYTAAKSYGLGARDYYRITKATSNKWPNGDTVEGSKIAKQIEILMESDVPSGKKYDVFKTIISPDTEKAKTVFAMTETAGIGNEEYLKAYAEAKQITGTKDGKGKTIAGSHDKNLLNYLNRNSSISVEQRKALYLMFATTKGGYNGTLQGFVNGLDVSAEQKKAYYEALKK